MIGDVSGDVDREADGHEQGGHRDWIHSHIPQRQETEHLQNKKMMLRKGWKRIWFCIHDPVIFLCLILQKFHTQIRNKYSWYYA